jgi:DNA-binding LacI/PurR family transcriptional regulator
MKQVASLAGVSTTTVSRVIDQNGYVTPALQDKVRWTMAVLNYQLRGSIPSY